MDDWFEWNGVRSTDYGIRVMNFPSYIKPAERLETVKIPGRPGSLTILEGSNIYENIGLSCYCVVDDPFYIENGTDRISKISSWLKGKGTIKFANRSNGFYNGRITNQISFDKIVRGNPHRSFQVTFNCHPFFMLDSGNEKVTLTNSSTYLSTELTNPGNLPSTPMMRLHFRTPEELASVGNNMLSRIEISRSLESDITLGVLDNYSVVSGSIVRNYPYIDIDLEAKYAYYGSTPKTMGLQGEWFTFPTGTFDFAIDGGGISSIEILPRWRCIG